MYLSKENGAIDLREESLETWDHCRSNEVVYLSDTMGTLRNSRNVAAELYRNGDGWVEIQFVLHGQRDAYYMAIIRCDRFHQSAGIVPSGEAGEVKQNLVPINRNTPVLVEVTHLVKPPKRMRFVGCPSVVWLKKFKLTKSFLGQPFRLITKAISAFESIDFENRKLGLFGDTFKSSKCPDQLVERRSHVVEGISDNQRKGFGQIDELHVQDVPLIFNVFLADDGASIRGSGKGLNFPVESLQMLVRPTQLQLSVRYSWHGDASPNV